MAAGAAASIVSPRALAAPTLRSTACEAWLYLLPLVEIAAVRARLLAAGPANRFVHQADITTVASQRVTAPNNDTLNSRTFLDLRGGPVTLTLPPSGSRYLSLALIDMFSNNIVVLGTRTTGPEGGAFVVAGPDGAAPPGAIRAPGTCVFALGRTLVNGPDDLVAARAVQTAIAASGPTSPVPWAPPVARDAAWRDYFTGAGRLLAETGAPVSDRAFFARVARLGLTPTGFAPPDFSPAEIAEIEQGVADARRYAIHPDGDLSVTNGWLYPRANLGRFGQDYAARGYIALTGLFALPVEEAIYTRTTGDAADGLFHRDGYHLRFAADALPPVDGFWSLALYEATPAGQFFFTPNAIDRYSIGDRTPGLVRGADGSLDIWISRTDPGPRRHANWLPAPRTGPYLLSMRAYLPRPALLYGNYRFPPVERLRA